MSSTPSSRRPYKRAFTLRLKPGCADEYRRRHDQIWPEMRATLLDHGVTDYSIFEGPAPDQLVAVVAFNDEDRWLQVGKSPVGARWRQYMSDLLECDASFRPTTLELPEVFRL